MNEQSKYFYCYNMNLSKYLYEKGFRYIHKAREIKTGNIFSCYEVTDGLSAALKSYKSNN